MRRAAPPVTGKLLWPWLANLSNKSPSQSSSNTHSSRSATPSAAPSGQGAARARHVDDDGVEIHLRRRADDRLGRHRLGGFVPRPALGNAAGDRLRDQRADLLALKRHHFLVVVVAVELWAEVDRMRARIEPFDDQEAAGFKE